VGSAVGCRARRRDPSRWRCADPDAGVWLVHPGYVDHLADSLRRIGATVDAASVAPLTGHGVLSATVTVAVDPVETTSHAYCFWR
jgi:hypothetical protein